MYWILNKYTRWYHIIIGNAKKQNRQRGSTYYESHHIMPKSLGGNNTKENRVLLTAKEHFVCHLLLTKMSCGEDRRKMTWAMWNLANNKGNHKQNRDVKISSRMYELVRKIYNGNVSGYKHSEETKKKIRKSVKDVTHLTVRFGENNGEFKGYYHTPWGKFVTSKEAMIKSPYKMDRKRIARLCLQKECFKTQRSRLTMTPHEWAGRSAKEVGFWFEPK